MDLQAQPEFPGNMQSAASASSAWIPKHHAMQMQILESYQVV